MNLYILKSYIDNKERFPLLPGFIPDRSCDFPELRYNDVIYKCSVDEKDIVNIEYPYIYVKVNAPGLKLNIVDPDDEKIEDLLHLKGAAISIGVNSRPDPILRKAACANPCDAYLYAKRVDKEPSNETRIAACGSANFSYLYAKDIDEAPLDETRCGVAYSPEYCYFYARDVVKGRDKKLEEFIVNGPHYAFMYIAEICGGFCPDGMLDKIKIDCQNVIDAATYLGTSDRLREIAAQDPIRSRVYAEEIDHGPNDITRLGALQAPATAYYYAAKIDKCPRDDTRKAASQNPVISELYARDVDGGFHPVTYVGALNGIESAKDYIRDFIANKTKLMNEILIDNSYTSDLILLNAKHEAMEMYPEYFS